MQNKQTPRATNRTKEPINRIEIGNIWKQCFTQEAQASLSQLVSLSKEKAVSGLLNSMANRRLLSTILEDENPKVRKNAARLIGALAQNEDSQALESALEQEKTLFVVSSIILALGNCGQESSCLKISQKVSTLDQDFEQVSPKHKSEIINAASLALSKLSPKQSATFSGFEEAINFFLVAPKDCATILIEEGKRKNVSLKLETPDIASVYSKDYGSLFGLRTFEEALIPLGSFGAIQNAQASDTVIRTWIGKEIKSVAFNFKKLVSKALSDASIRYRIEIKNCPENASRVALAKLVGAYIDENSNFQNSPSNYDCELRLDFGEKNFAFAKLFVPKDLRYNYRLDSLPASINPTIAACLLQFAAHYLKPGARVIDPCCGSATILIERSKMGKTSEIVGIDRETQALKIARKNCEAAGVEAAIIGGNLTSFKPDQKFDELVANLPFGTRVGTQESSAQLHKTLVSRFDEYLNVDGTAVVFTTRRHTLLRIADHSPWKIVLQKEFHAGGLSPWGIVMRRQ